jgi:hypothetical protein
MHTEVGQNAKSAIQHMVTQNVCVRARTHTHTQIYMYKSDLILECNAYLFCYCQIFTVEDNKVGLFFYMKFYCHLT